MSLRFLFDNLGDRIVPSYTTQDAAFPGRNLFDGNRATFWKGTSTAIHYVTFDAGVAVPCDYVALSRADLLVAAGATVVVQYSTDNFSANIVDAFTPVTLSSLFQIASQDWWSSFTQQTKRYWRLKISGLTSVPVLAGLWLGVQSSAYGGLDDPASFGVVRLLRGADLAGSFTSMTPALASELAAYVAAVTPYHPLESVAESVAGVIYGAVPHWIYNDDGSHFRKPATPVLLNVQLLTPDPEIAIRSYNLHDITNLRWRQVK